MSSTPKEAPIGRSTGVDQSTLYRLRDRVRQLEQQLKALHGASDVWKSKVGKATEREQFLLDEVKKASEDMLGKQPPSPRAPDFVFSLLFSFFMFCAGIKLNAKEEERRVKRRLIALDEVASWVPPYWQERPLGYALVLLQDRADQVDKFVECCRATLAMVHDELFPLDPAPEGGCCPVGQILPRGERP